MSSPPNVLSQAVEVALDEVISGVRIVKDNSDPCVDPQLVEWYDSVEAFNVT